MFYFILFFYHVVGSDLSHLMLIWSWSSWKEIQMFIQFDKRILKVIERSRMCENREKEKEEAGKVKISLERVRHKWYIRNPTLLPKKKGEHDNVWRFDVEREGRGLGVTMATAGLVLWLSHPTESLRTRGRARHIHRYRWYCVGAVMSVLNVPEGVQCGLDRLLVALGSDRWNKMTHVSVRVLEEIAD